MTVKLIQCLDCPERFMSTDESDNRCAKCQAKRNVNEIRGDVVFPPPAEPEAFDRPMGGCVSHAKLTPDDINNPMFGVQEIDVPDMHGHPRFYEVLDDLANLHSRKAHAYEGSNPHYHNYRENGRLWMNDPSGFKYALMRAYEKMIRIQNMTLDATIPANDEAITDSLDDIAVIAIIAKILWEEKNNALS